MSIEISLPIGKRVTYSVHTNATWPQRIHVYSPNSRSHDRIYEGVGEGTDLGGASFTVGGDLPALSVIVDVKHQRESVGPWVASGLGTWKPPSSGPYQSIVVGAEDGGGQDGDDSLIIFNWYEFSTFKLEEIKSAFGGAPETTAELVERAMSYPIPDVLKRYSEEVNLPVDVVKEHERELKRFLLLCAMDPQKQYGMRGPIDEMWHTFVVFTKQYSDFCQSIAGRFIHHFPNVDRPDRPKYRVSSEPQASTVKKPGLREGYLAFLGDYQLIFGEEPPAHLWPRPAENEELTFTGVGCGCACGCGCRCLA